MWEFVVFFGQAALIFLLFAYSSKQRDRVKELKSVIKRLQANNNKIEGGTELFFKQVDGITRIQ